VLSLSPIMNTLLILLIGFCHFITVHGGGAVCENAKVQAQSYTTRDATILYRIAYIAEFTLDCSNDANDGGVTLYADVNGESLPVLEVGDESRYQISWTEDVKTARRGDYNIRIFNEERFQQLKKAQRHNEDTSSVEPLVTVVLYHPGAYYGPWVNSEFMAAALAVVIGYVAFSAKSKLLA